MKLQSVCRMVLTSFAALMTCAATHAADYPDRVAKVVVPYGPGGGVDTFTRPVAAFLGKRLGQQFIVDNRPGAGGTIGVKMVAGAPADGYTILSGGVHQPMAESLYPKRGYDMEKDFVPLALTAVVPNVLVVRPDLPAKTVEELIAYGRANPGRLSYCSSGNGTSQHIIAESFRDLAKMGEMLHIPHKGTAPAMTTLLSGQCDMMFDGLATSIPHITSGKLLALALTSAARSRHYPNIPTMGEVGGPTMDAGTWYGWWVVTTTPKEIVAKLRDEIGAVLTNSELKTIWATQGAELPMIPQAEVEDYVRSEIQRWTKATRDAGIKAE